MTNCDPDSFASFGKFQKLIKSFKSLTNRFPNGYKLSSRQPAWKGLSRYRTAVHVNEYAKVTTLLDCPELDLTYYSDTVGPVPAVSLSLPAMVGLESLDIGNGGLSPEWGVDVVIRGGTVTYGPWTDRQRTDLMKVFSPSIFHDAVPAKRLLPGDQRLHSALKIFVEFANTTTLRVPTREASKVSKELDSPEKHFLIARFIRIGSGIG